MTASVKEQVQKVVGMLTQEGWGSTPVWLLIQELSVMDEDTTLAELRELVETFDDVVDEVAVPLLIGMLLTLTPPRPEEVTALSPDEVNMLVKLAYDGKIAGVVFGE